MLRAGDAPLAVLAVVVDCRTPQPAELAEKAEGKTVERQQTNDNMSVTLYYQVMSNSGNFSRICRNLPTRHHVHNATSLLSCYAAAACRPWPLEKFFLLVGLANMWASTGSRERLDRHMDRPFRQARGH